MIYGFRGADVEGFYNQALSKNPMIFELGQNYRSSQTIVDAAQSLIKTNKTRPIDKHLFTENEIGNKITYINARTPGQEANIIARTIADNVASGKFKYSDCAVLYRNAYLSRNVEEAFLCNTIPYTINNGIGFFNRAEIKTIMDFVNFFVNPYNSISLRNIVNIPKAGIGDKTCEKVIGIFEEEIGSYVDPNINDSVTLIRDIATRCGFSKKFRGFIDSATAIGDWMDNLEEISAHDLVVNIVEYFSLENYFYEMDKEGFLNRKANIDQLINIADSYDSVFEFLNNFYLISDSEVVDKNDRVTLMTMHASKGLEFKVVFIVDMHEGVCPSFHCKEAANPTKALEEERRLFYVAMTRAKEELVILTTDYSFLHGKMVENTPSRFIANIDSEYVNMVQ